MLKKPLFYFDDPESVSMLTHYLRDPLPISTATWPGYPSPLTGII